MTSAPGYERPPVAEVLARERERLIGDPNIIGVGVGVRFRYGEWTDEMAIQYDVYEKYTTADELAEAGTEPIPSEVDGYPTDVLVMTPFDAAQCDMTKGLPTGDRGSRIEDPLVGGTSTSVLGTLHSFPKGYGTLGGLCFDRVTDASMALSNAHVWGTDTIGNTVIQPWLPTGELLGSVVKVLTCGPFAFLFEWEMPSPATAGLAAAAGFAWYAAAASDAEDPSRWGQTQTPPPVGFGQTDAENIRVAATALPDMPFAGIPYQAEVTWDYERQGDGGTLSASTVEKRVNEHVLFGKRVWTDLTAYEGGQRVEICAEIATLRHTLPNGFFVVAHVYSGPTKERVLRRVLVPGHCRARPEPSRPCVRGFPDGQPGKPAHLPMRVDIFGFSSEEQATYVGPLAGGEIGLSLPTSPLQITMPPASRVLIEIADGPSVEATARNSAGMVVDSATLQGGGGTIDLSSLEIVTVELSGPDAVLIEVCAVYDEWRPAAHEAERISRHTFRGHLDLELNETLGEWGISLSVQNVDMTPVGTDPVIAAATVGGVTQSSSLVGIFAGACALTFLFDYTFDVL